MLLHYWKHVFKQHIGIPMCVYPTSLFIWIKVYKKLISNGSSKAYKYQEVSRVIYDLCAINNDNEFLTSLKNIYSKELGVRVEHQIKFKKSW